MSEPLLSVEPIVAYRAWGVVVLSDDSNIRSPVLTPVTSPQHTMYQPSKWAGLPAQNIPWAQPGRWYEAECMRRLGTPGTLHQREVPSALRLQTYKWNCHCGFWSVKEPYQPELHDIVRIAWDWNTKQRVLARFVAGRVELKGRVVEHERGYRAQYARVTGLYSKWCAGDLADRLAVKYNVPLLEYPEEES